MPGTKTPAAVRYTRFQQMQDQGVLSEDFTGNELAPCIAHGDYVKVTDLASDHIDAKDRILNRQVELVNLLNTNPILAKIVMKLPGIEKFFIKKDLNTGEGEKYYGTLFFYELYFNDIDNLWLICHNCNSQKSDSDVADWFERQWLWSKDFFDFLCLEKEDKRLIRKKIKTQEGLAEVAINWFWEKHAGYIATTKKFYEEIKNPILLLNRKIDHIVGLGKLEKAQRYADELDFKIELMGAIIDTPGLREKGEDSSSDSDIFSYGSLSDTEDLPLPTSAEFRRARKRTIDEISDKVQKTLAYNVRAEKKTTKKPAKKAKLENLTPKESRNTNSNL